MEVATDLPRMMRFE